MKWAEKVISGLKVQFLYGLFLFLDYSRYFLLINNSVKMQGMCFIPVFDSMRENVSLGV